MALKAKDKVRQCAYCFRVFNKEEHLRRHERSHTGEKPFKCHKCDRRYGRSDVLARHLQTRHWERLSQTPQLANISQPAQQPTDNERRPLASAALRPHTNNPFQIPSQPFGVRGNDVSFPPPGAGLSPSAVYQPEFMSLNLPSLDDNEMSEASLLHDQQNSGALDGAREIGSSCTPRSTTWAGSQHTALNPDNQNVWLGLFAMPQARVTTHMSRYGGVRDPASNPATQNMPVIYRGTRSQRSFWQIMQDQDAMDSNDQEREEQRFERSFSPGSILESDIQPLHTEVVPSLGCEVSLFNPDFSYFNTITPENVDYLNFEKLPSTISDPPHPSNDSVLPPELLFTFDQMQRMQPLWCSQRSKPSTRIIRSLWHDVVQHQADNIFSRPSSDIVHTPPPSGYSKAPQWHFDDSCRQRVIAFARELDDQMLPQDFPHPTPAPSPPSTVSGSTSTYSLPTSTDGFPTTGVFHASLDHFFQNPPLHFIHNATFDAQHTPDPLLFTMCLIGLSSLYQSRSRDFVLRYQKGLMRFCRNNLMSKARSSSQPWELLIAMSSTLLTLYLGLGHLQGLDEYQAHILVVQALRTAEKHGLFELSQGANMTTELQAGPMDSPGSWKAWARIESIKRMISSLLSIDMAYARVIGCTGVIDMDKVELHLPCEDALFAASHVSQFLLLADMGARLRAPRIHIPKFHMAAPAKLNSISMETVLVSLFLQVAGLRHKQPATGSSTLEHQSILSQTNKTNAVVETILLLPSKYSELFQQQHRNTVMAWNNVCIALTADISLLQMVTGRDGLEAAQTATITVSNWAQMPCARRAALHAAQLFDILSSSRLSESNIARPDLLLFTSALVLYMYLAVARQNENEQGNTVFELLQDIDWACLGGEGLPGHTQEMTSPSSGEGSLPPEDRARAAKNFIRHGGPVSFAGESLQLGDKNTTRRIFLRYISLLNDLGKWRESRYSQLLRAMSDFVVEDRQ